MKKKEKNKEKIPETKPIKRFVGIMLDPEVHNRIRALAEQEGVSVSFLVRRAANKEYAADLESVALFAKK